jgi:hypothetical protein
VQRRRLVDGVEQWPHFGRGGLLGELGEAAMVNGEGEQVNPLGMFSVIYLRDYVF